MLILAHRGASKYAPENTLEAFRKAMVLGADGVELDVQMTKDKVPVVIHSDRLTPFTTTYTFVHATPFRALQTIDVGGYFSHEFTGTRIPTLAQVLDLLAAMPACRHINLELKAQPYWHFGMEEQTIDLVKEYGVADRVLFSSFSPLVLWRLRNAAPDIPRALLIEPRAFFFLRTQFFGKVLSITHLHPFHETTTPKLMRCARDFGWKVMTWTVNSRVEIERAINLGVDGIITDDPVLAKEVVGCHLTNPKKLS